MTDEWSELLEAAEVIWCPDCDEYRPLHNHGWIENTEDGTVFHWRPRRRTQPGVHKALRKIVIGTRPDLGALPPWRSTYLRNAEILRLAKQARVRLPRTVFDLDRARLRYMLGEYSMVDRRRMTPSEQADFTAALRWAARS